jgi:hypothetical protein
MSRWADENNYLSQESKLSPTRLATAVGVTRSAERAWHPLVWTLATRVSVAFFLAGLPWSRLRAGNVPPRFALAQFVVIFAERYIQPQNFELSFSVRALLRLSLLSWHCSLLYGFGDNSPFSAALVPRRTQRHLLCRDSTIQVVHWRIETNVCPNIASFH